MRFVESAEVNQVTEISWCAHTCVTKSINFLKEAFKTAFFLVFVLFFDDLFAEKIGDRLKFVLALM